MLFAKEQRLGSTDLAETFKSVMQTVRIFHDRQTGQAP